LIPATMPAFNDAFFKSADDFAKNNFTEDNKFSVKTASGDMKVKLDGNASKKTLSLKLDGPSWNKVKLDKAEVKDNGKTVNFDFSHQFSNEVKLEVTTSNPADVSAITASVAGVYKKADLEAALSVAVLSAKDAPQNAAELYATFNAGGFGKLGVKADVIPASLMDPTITVANKKSFGDIAVVSQAKFKGAFKDLEGRLAVESPVGSAAALTADAAFKKGVPSLSAGLKYKWDSNGTLFAKVDQAGNKDLAYKMTLGPLSTLSLSVSEKSSSLAWNLELSA